MLFVKFLYVLLFIQIVASQEKNGFCLVGEEKCHSIDAIEKKYLLYDVNHGEGFNLRRDVYMRMASLVRMLGPAWTLVLPRWTGLPHWRSRNKKKQLDEEGYRWSAYFDVESMARYIAVIEFDDFLHKLDIDDDQVDVVISLEHFHETFEGEAFNWYEHFELKNCTTSKYFEVLDGKVYSLFGDEELRYRRLVCVKIEGYVSTLRQLINERFKDSRIVLVSSAEVVLHSEYGDVEYWKCRRSMRFNRQLVKIAADFRRQQLGSTDQADGTVLDKDWRMAKQPLLKPVGGNYLAVHLRRADFARARPEDTPTIECAVEQIKWIAKKFGLTKVFVASDGSTSEVNELESRLNNLGLKMFKFTNNGLSDGRRAVVDQVIAAHAKIFVGTLESTFSFRIQEEREIIGFDSVTTFNAFCGDCKLLDNLCQQQSKWTVVY